MAPAGSEPKIYFKKLTIGSFISTTGKYGHDAVPLCEQLDQLHAVILRISVPQVDRPVLATHWAPGDLVDT